MNTVPTFAYRHAPRIALLLALAVLAWSALVLLGSVVLAAAGAGPLPPPDARLAPFRWTPLGSDLA